MFKIGDFVTRNSYNNDILFTIIDIKDDIAYLKGIDVRLYADSSLDDLEEADVDYDTNKDRNDAKKIKDMLNLDRSEYFYLPGKILHIDGDKDYLRRCIDFYKDMHLEAYGVNLDEDDFSKEITSCLEKYNPDILVITGHDSFKKNKDKSDLANYQNSLNFVKATMKAREYERNQDKLIIIAGACQSFYEDLIKAGANFASSPKRINIHALDPAIIASTVALSPKNKEIDLISLLSKTHYGSNGMGGIITNGVMYVGYPR
ncbi:MAG TPA: peptidase [Candidatus Onthousia excrementipullorum]|uniref:Peptidase n=1 Tax=Candidatus Onthousia excrementipullorum TaxID=2840884 RepID=A0A9D1DUY3_9FIRM|nr:peptidase [Candidatus Onthousia excrementipullorum]